MSAPGHFGEHLMLDGYQGSEARLNDRGLVLQCLNELPHLLGMNKLAQPAVYRALDNGKKDPGGWSGVVVIAESHISIHTFPAIGFVSIDAYTCRNGLDTRYVVDYFTDKFALKRTELNFVERGRQFARLAAMRGATDEAYPDRLPS